MNWLNPLNYAAALKDEENMVLLHSGMKPGRHSIIAWELQDKINALENFFPAENQKWFGYLGYGLRGKLESLPRSKDSVISLPDFLMMQFKNVLIFDHETQTISGNKNLLPAESLPSTSAVAKPLDSNMSDDEYKKNVSAIIKKIHAGEIYQANLTRKFFGSFEKTADTFSLFCKLSEISPAPYSAYIKFGGYSIISASPEKFLSVENGVATTCPIKGTLSSASPAALLAMSQKDRAENLMIVDLMRNDLSRTCKNVRVEKLFEVTSYKAYHHMSSTILGDTTTSPLEVALGCFPPGSMTGAPKIHAMKLCNELEGIERGVYSGAIGYFEGVDKCDLSVVIRTLITHDNKFEFQVGGGIVADSTPEKELEEIYVKAAPILKALGVGID